MTSRPPIELHLRIRVAAEQREAFLAFLTEAIPVYERPGGIRIRLLEDAGDAGRFIEVVEYDSQEAFDRDQERVEQDPESRALLERWRALLDGPPQVEVYRHLS
jgi:quinol monooxygenase YgiN